MRVVLDTNVPISALMKPGGSAGRVISAMKEGRITNVTSEPILAELEDVADRPYVRKYGVSAESAAELIVLLRQVSAIIPVPGTLRICPDPDDDMVIETAVHGSVMMLVTGDKHLSRVEVVRAHLDQWNIKVVSINNLLAILDYLAGLETG